MSVYTVSEIIGVSPDSWEDAAKNALTEAAQTLRHMRVAEVSDLDVTLTDDGQIKEYRTKVKVSVKHEAR